MERRELTPGEIEPLPDNSFELHNLASSVEEPGSLTALVAGSSHALWMPVFPVRILPPRHLRGVAQW